MLRMRLTVMIAAAAVLAFSVGCSNDRPADGPDGSPAARKRRGPTTRPAVRRGPATSPAGGAKPRVPATKPSTGTKAGNPVVVIETSMGTIKAELWIEKAPITVKNFLRYVDEKHYDNMVFHRILKGFMIQGGGFDVMMRQRRTHEQIKNEATADKKNLRGTLAMARTGIVDSATSQFFINHADNAFLDHRDETMRGFGYCAFGKVTEGMDVVDKLAAAPVKFNDSPRPEKSVPIKPVLIKSIRRAE